jgi:hypothetical protein
MSRERDIGYCETCHKQFGYRLIHNGFNDSVYAYCDNCGEACLLNLWQIPKGIEINDYGIIPESVHSFLKPCSCGGTFRKGAAPRCPHCNSILSPIEAAKYIEANAPGAKIDWQWQQSWEGLYCILVGNNVWCDCWKETNSQ